MTSWSPVDRVELDNALRSFDRRAVQRLTRKFIDFVHDKPDPVPEMDGLLLLRSLRGKRHFPQVQDVAESLLAHGLDSVSIRHEYAMAMINRGRTAAAESLLGALPLMVQQSDTEILGAIGRLHKQRYVTTGPAGGNRRSADLNAALRAYDTAYQRDRKQNYYQGINVVAMLSVAEHDGVPVEGFADPATAARQIAESIRTQIADGIHTRVERNQEPAAWEFATAAEACLALGNFDEAVDWLAYYVGTNTGADAFEYASTLQQFTEVWRLTTDTEPGLRLIPLLRNRLLQSEGGEFEVRPAELSQESLTRFDTVQCSLAKLQGTTYEQVYGWDQFQSLRWLRTAMETCRSVAQINDRWDNGVGTAFVLDGAAICPGVWPSRVLLTNAHVIPGAVSVDKATATFSGADEGGPSNHRVGPVLWSSPREKLDACFLALSEDVAPQAVALKTRKAFPVLGGENEPRAYVIGYPMGRPQLQLSLHDSKLLGSGENYAYYRSATQNGSSGSPVFDSDWEVIALHHGFNETMHGSANEGIRMDSLIDAVRKGEMPSVDAAQ